MDTFTEGRKLTQNVTGDTQLFEGNMGQSPDGTDLSTYQSILSLASDMNQPDLVYKVLTRLIHLSFLFYVYSYSLFINLTHFLPVYELGISFRHVEFKKGSHHGIFFHHDSC